MGFLEVVVWTEATSRGANFEMELSTEHFNMNAGGLGSSPSTKHFRLFWIRMLEAEMMQLTK